MGRISKKKNAVRNGAVYKREPVKGKLSRTLVKFCIGFLVVYTVVNNILFYFVQVEPSTLTTCVYAAFSGELLFLCLKRIFAKADEANGKEIDDDGGEL